MPSSVLEQLLNTQQMCRGEVSELHTALWVRLSAVRGAASFSKTAISL